MQNSNKLIGQVASAPANEGFGFISLASTAKIDGSPHGLDTTADIYLHKDDANAVPKVGMLFSFEVTPDRIRGEGFYRAQSAVEEIEAELIPAGEQPMPGFNALAPFGDGTAPNLGISPTEIQLRKAPPVNKETLGVGLGQQASAIHPTRQ